MTSASRPRPHCEEGKPSHLEETMPIAEGLDPSVQSYIDGIAPEHRPLFDRIHGLILAEHPEATVVLSYNMPTYKVGGRRLYVGLWKHGVSIYGWQRGGDAGFAARHPELKASKS